MATIIFTDHKTKQVTAKEGIKLMLIQRGSLPATKAMQAYLKKVQDIVFDTGPAVNPHVRLPYKE